ncbi:uncharacterized protein G2W53_031450 [Senna tora]|uniref:Uncharacterized protein n=1 Tax=Senna tora TaxID=362788 RepID=A0A834T991_9FABA|nr:uncharacterized protein G2W53_031450 [Senna tora]
MHKQCIRWGWCWRLGGHGEYNIVQHVMRDETKREVTQIAGSGRPIAQDGLYAVYDEFTT